MMKIFGNLGSMRTLLEILIEIESNHGTTKVMNAQSSVQNPGAQNTIGKGTPKHHSAIKKKTTEFWSSVIGVMGDFNLGRHSAQG